MNNRTRLRAKTAAIAAVLAALLSACGSPIDTGYVTGKNYERPWNQTVWDRTCVRYDRDGYCAQHIQTPRTVHHPAEWTLTIREGDQDGWVDVDETTYHRYEIGMHYPDPR